MCVYLGLNNKDFCTDLVGSGVIYEENFQARLL